MSDKIKPIPTDESVNIIAWSKDLVEGIGEIDERVDTIITTAVPGVSAQEIVDARQGSTSLGGNLTAMKTRLTNAETKATSLDGRVEELEKREKIMRYGVRRKLGATSAELERLGDAVGLVANADTSLTSYNAVQNDFDGIFPWSHLRECIIEESGKIIYKGYPRYESSEGDYMIEVPSFYLKHTNDGENLEYWVSANDGQDYEKTEKFYISQFKTSDDHKSRPFVAPLVFNPLNVYRDGARAKGDGWQTIDMKGLYILRVLYQIEFAHLNSQSKLGTGVTGVSYAANAITANKNNTNTVDVTTTVANLFEIGETVTIGTSLGSSSAIAHNRIVTGKTANTVTVDGDPFNVTTSSIIYHVGQHTGKTLELTSSSGQSVGRSGRASISYRGVEDIFGNVYDWVDGVLINDHQSYVCDDPTKFSNSLTSDYKPVGYTNLAQDGYPLQMGFDINHKEIEFPVQVGAGTSTGYCDYYYQNTGLRASLFGGYFYLGSFAGLFRWTLHYAPSSVSVSIGSRLLYRP